MIQALLRVARCIAEAHDRVRSGLGRRPLSGEVAQLEEQVLRLKAENDLLRARFLRVPSRRRPHYRPHECLDILWHRARHRLSIPATAQIFAISRQTVLNWIRVAERRQQRLVQADPPVNRLPDLVAHLTWRLKAEWPRWGTRRIAGQLARLGVRASRSSVQRILQRRPARPSEPEVVTGSRGRVLLAKRPNHIWMIDFTRIGGVIRPLWIGAVVDVFSRRVLSIRAVRGAPSSAFAVRLLREAMRRNAVPRWLGTDKDPVLRGGLVQRLLTGHGILRRYGAVGRKGSIAIIERLWLSMKEEYVSGLFLYRPLVSIERALKRYVLWRNQERPHQGLQQRTPNDIYFARRRRPLRNTTRGTLHVGFLGGDKRLPVLRLRKAA